MKPSVPNTADVEQQNQAKAREKFDRQTELNDIRALMNIPEGRRFMWRLINQICHYDADDAQHSGSLTYYSLGERNIGRIMKAEVYEASLDAWQLMEKEHVKKEQGGK